MSGGRLEINYDSDPIFQGTHDGPNGSSYLQSKGAMFNALGCIQGLAIENVTQGLTTTVGSCTDDVVMSGDVFDMEFDVELGITWNTGDAYKIYKTSEKDSKISHTLVDVSRGWASDPRELVDGWIEEDVDLDDHGKYEVFGPGQPE